MLRDCRRERHRTPVAALSATGTWRSVRIPGVVAAPACDDPDRALSDIVVDEGRAPAKRMAYCYEVLPQAVTDNPGRLNWAYPPTVDLRLVAEKSFDSPSNSRAHLSRRCVISDVSVIR
jgi:hypothetical protein